MGNPLRWGNPPVHIISIGWVTRHVTSPIWGPPPPRKQVLSLSLFQRLFAEGTGKYIGGTFMKLTVIERSLIDAFQAFKRIELQFTKQSIYYKCTFGVIYRQYYTTT